MRVSVWGRRGGDVGVWVLIFASLFWYAGAIAYTSAFFGQGSGPILMDDLFCTGSERYLVNCTYDRYTGDCRHYEDAGVRCQCEQLTIQCFSCSVCVTFVANIIWCRITFPKSTFLPPSSPSNLCNMHGMAMIRIKLAFVPLKNPFFNANKLWSYTCLNIALHATLY